MQEFRVNHKQYGREGKDTRFSEGTIERIGKLIARYPAGKQKSALLPVLHLVQEECGGHLSVDAMDRVAVILNIQPIEVYEVATFYTQFSLEKRGKYLIEICHTAPCAICGGEMISKQIGEKLRISPGESTPDGLFTLREVECLGACGGAPAMQINNEFYENLTPEKVITLLDELAKDKNGINPGKGKWAEELF